VVLDGLLQRNKDHFVALHAHHFAVAAGDQGVYGGVAHAAGENAVKGVGFASALGVA